MGRISAHSCPSNTTLAFALFSFFLSQSTTKLTLKHRPKTTYFLAIVKPNRVKTWLQQGASSGALRGRLRWGPYTSRGGPGVAAKLRPVPASPNPPVHWSGPVYWHMTQPVHTVQARATRAQPPFFLLFRIFENIFCQCFILELVWIFCLQLSVGIFGWVWYNPKNVLVYLVSIIGTRMPKRFCFS